jgi:hypothetical protein
MAPPAFESMVREGLSKQTIKFTNGKDATDIVIPQYEIGFKRLMDQARKLSTTATLAGEMPSSRNLSPHSPTHIATEGCGGSKV